MKRAAVVALALLTACAGSPNTRPNKAKVTTTTASTTTTVATTTTTAVALAKPCAATDLGVDSIQQDGASQHVLTYVLLRNTSTFTCSLSGFPTSLAAVDQNGSALDDYQEGAYQPDPPAGNVAPNETGILIIDTKSACESNPPARNLKNFQIGFPGGGTVSLGDFVINGACGVAVSKLGVQKK